MVGIFFFIIFAPEIHNMTLRKWIEVRAIHGYPMFYVINKMEGKESNGCLLYDIKERVYKDTFIYSTCPRKSV